MILSVGSCGGGDPGTASGSAATVKAVSLGVSPFIAFVELHISSGLEGASVQYSIQPKPGSVSRPVSVSYSFSYLTKRGYFDVKTRKLTVPVFGLYQNYSNHVAVQLNLLDKSVPPLQVEIDTPAYSDPNGIYDHPNVLKARAEGTALGFDYFYMKSALGGPVVVDTDGEVRWVVPGTMNSTSSLLYNNAFIIGDQASLRLQRLELDGTVVNMLLGGASDLTSFHHNIDRGKTGLLAEVNATDNGVSIIETKLVEFNPTSGAILKQWDLADILSRYMSSRGDNPTAFVRPGVDWFHMNSATYDPSDDSLIVSSRENFVVKIDYAGEDLIWIFGDPTKYWHTFPSLAAKSLMLAAGGLYPIGQHAVSIAHDGSLLLFNDGTGSFNQPTGQPAGQSRPYSVISDYLINATNQSAAEAWRFDYGQSILSQVCSSAYESASDTSMLVDYAVADGGAHARLVGLDQSRSVVFDLEYSTKGCGTSWNAIPIAFDAMTFQ
jgi:hypothetical protein